MEAKFRIDLADTREWLRAIPSNSVHCCVTSPPYWNLRDYGFANQIGLEETLEQHLRVMRCVFREVRRILHPTGVLWLNYGDAWAQPGVKPIQDEPKAKFQQELARNAERAKERSYINGLYACSSWERASGTCKGANLAPKQKLLLPHRVALNLQADGWWMRDDDVANEITWHKPNGKPESIRDRPSKGHEYIFLMSKRASYFYDSFAVREPSGAQLRSVWSIPTQGTYDGHTATFPEELARRCILLGSSGGGVCEKCLAPFYPLYTTETDPAWQRACGGNADGEYHGQAHKDYASTRAETPGEVKRRILAGLVTRRLDDHKPRCKCGAPPIPATVMDCFAGTATVGVMALRNNRSFIGVEGNPDYRRIAYERLQSAQISVPVAEMRAGQQALF